MGLHLTNADVTTGLVILSLLISGLRWAHDWIGKREAESVDLPKDIAAINKRLDYYDQRNSEAMSKINTRIGSMELDIREIFTMLRRNEHHV